MLAFFWTQVLPCCVVLALIIRAQQKVCSSPGPCAHVQDFERAFHAEMMLEAESDRLRLPRVKLPDWIRTYAARAWQDRIYLERTVSPLQVSSGGSVAANPVCIHPDPVDTDVTISWATTGHPQAGHQSPAAHADDAA